jgi:hypothetical protein
VADGVAIFLVDGRLAGRLSGAKVNSSTRATGDRSLIAC